MAIQNSWVYTHTEFDAEKFLRATRNLFQLVSQRPFVSKKNPDEKGVRPLFLYILLVKKSYYLKSK